MSARTCTTDWRNVASPNFDRTRKADLWSLYWTATEASTKGIVGKKLVAWQPGVLYAPDGTPAGAPYNVELDQIAKNYGALMDHALHEGVDGTTLRMLDLTKRGFVAAMAQLRAKHFGSFDGTHLDYFAGVRNWFPPGFLDENWADHWDRGLAAFTAILRSQKPDAIIVGQNDRLTGDLWSATSGCYLERSPFFNGRSLNDHAQDLKTFNETIRRFDPARELVSVCEIREPWRFNPAVLKAVLKWCDDLGLYVSMGRDSTARGATGGLS